MKHETKGAPVTVLLQTSCANCSNPAHARFEWLTSRGRQTADLCKRCCQHWWDTYGRTPAGETLRITGAFVDRDLFRDRQEPHAV